MKNTSRLFLAFAAVAMSVAAAVHYIFPTGEMPVRLEISQSANGPNITQDVQKVAGYLPDRVGHSAPSLGKITVIRPEIGTHDLYMIDANRPLHVYVIGKGPAPRLFTFKPGRRGHSSKYKIVLQNVAE